MPVCVHLEASTREGNGLWSVISSLPKRIDLIGFLRRLFHSFDPQSLMDPNSHHGTAQVLSPCMRVASIHTGCLHRIYTRVLCD